MNFWKRLLFVLVAALPLAAMQASAIPLDKVPKQTTDLVSLQHGAKVFVNYCLGCHAASFMRYTKLQELGLSQKEIEDNLLLATDDIGTTMTVAMDPVKAKDWFGVNPPDLSVIARALSGPGGSGADYVYTLLRTYYRDPTPPTGWNNLVFPNIGMPHPLWELQGEREPIFAGEGDKKVFTGRWKQVTKGTLTPVEYEETVADLANYLAWMAEPVQNKRIAIGVWVMIFLFLFTLIAWRLNASYWKDVE
ncbi:MAG: cytochrome c1 [Ottowia sp.]|nr:cytochrome c1 [Ottowia sp.]